VDAAVITAAVRKQDVVQEREVGVEMLVSTSTVL
jgi:hypothetical protein